MANDGGFVLTGGVQTSAYRLVALKHALRLETMGYKHSRGSAYQTIKREFGFKGSKQSVLKQFTEHLHTFDNPFVEAIVRSEGVDKPKLDNR